MGPRGHITILGLTILTLGHQVQGQIRFTQDNADCVGAVLITDSIFGPVSPGRGFGNVLEIRENPKEDARFFEREHHTIWYKFRTPWACELTLDIIPIDLNDDYDFMLFEGAIPGICDKIFAKEHAPIRTNISRNDPAIGSQCGLSTDGIDEFVRSGVGSPYSKSLQAEAGELFYLVVDNPQRPLAGYTVHLHFGQPPDQPHVLEKNQQKLKVSVKDRRTNAPLVAALSIEGLSIDSVVEAKGRTDYEFVMEKFRHVKVNASRKGYMLHSAKSKPSMNEVVELVLDMVPIATGEHVALEDIRFVGNEDLPLRSSESTMLQLLFFMQDNPSLRIEIQGHVNGPTFKNKTEFIQLSEARAKRIHDFLLVNDIAPERLTYKGFGNSMMIYPEPRNREQSEANRRVEIKVLSN